MCFIKKVIMGKIRINRMCYTMTKGIRSTKKMNVVIEYDELEEYKERMRKMLDVGSVDMCFDKVEDVADE